MIDDRLLADPTRCPSCASPLGQSPTACPACRLPLDGPVAARLWQVSVETVALLTRRSELISQLRAQASRPADTTAPASVAGPPAPGVQPPGSPPPVQPPVVRPEWTPRRVQNLLLVLGAGLLGVAAVIFVAVSWGRLGVGGRAAVMTGVTAVAAYAGLATRRRGLTATAEALSLLTVGLALLDCAGAWASDLFGLGSVDGAVVAAGSAALVAVAAGLGAGVLPTRALRLSAAVLAQLSLPLLLNEAAQHVDNPAALVATGLTAQTFGALTVVGLWPWGAATRDARTAVAVGGTLAGLLASVTALGAAYVEDGSLVPGTALLVVAALGLAVAAELLSPSPDRSGGTGAPGHPPLRYRGWVTGLRGGAAALAVAAAWAPVVHGVSDRWLAVALSATALVLLAVTRAVPADRRTAPGAVFLLAACLPALSAADAVLAAVLGRLQWLDRSWTLTGSPSAREALTGTSLDGFALVTTTQPPAVLLLVVSIALAAAAGVVPRLRYAATAAVPVAATTGLLAAPALRTPYALALGVDLGLALVLLVGGTLLVRSRRYGTSGPAVAALASGSGVLGLGVAWSFARDVSTLVVLPATAAVLLVAVVAARGLERLRGARVAASVGAGSLLVAEAGALASYTGSGAAAVTALVLSLAAVVAAAGSLLVAQRAPADRFWHVVRRALAVAAATAAVAAAGAVSWWQGAGEAGAGLAVTVAAALLLAAATLPAPARWVAVTDLRVVAGLGGAVGLLGASADPDRLWTALLALGVGVTVHAVAGIRGDHRWGWLAGLLLAGSSWVRLALSDVDAPEAYTVPTALALLAVGLLRRRREPAYRSWHAYAPGLGLALVPSLVRAVTDAGELRPFLLGVAALAVLGVGVARRLQAPLVIGATVLAVDATVQLAPYLATAYDAVPRWVTIGVVGLLLLAAGATFEQRLRDLRRMSRHVTGLG